MIRAPVALLALALTDCVLDYDALRGSTDGGPRLDATPSDGGGTSTDEDRLYPAVVSACATGWRGPVIADDFSAPLASRWSWTNAPWVISNGQLEVDMMMGDDYFTRHILRTGAVLRSYWLRVDITHVEEDAYPQIHLRVDPSASSERFFGVRLRGEAAGLLLVRQSQATDRADGEAMTIFEEPFAIGSVHRVVVSVREAMDGSIEIVAGAYDLDGALPVLHPTSRVSHVYPAGEAHVPGSIGLSGFQRRSRFDNLVVFECDP